MIDRPQGRDLDSEELRALATSMGQRPELWRHLVRHDPAERVFEQVQLDEHVGIWLLCWMRGHDTGFHDHDISSGAFTVVEGQLVEERLRFAAAPTSITLDPGDSTHFTARDIHRVLHSGDAPAVSIHAYSPPLVRMGSYVVQEGGALLREPLGPTQELRPLAAAA